MAALLAAALAAAGGSVALADRFLTAQTGVAAGADGDRAGGDRASRGELSPTSEPSATAAATPTAATPAGPTPTATAPTTAAPAAPAPVRSATPAPTRPTSQVERMENEVTTLVNAERAKAGCGAVRTDERLRTAARGHSADMAAHDYFSHTGRDGSSPWDRAGRAGYTKAIGENIAYGYRTAAEVVQGWMDSQGHRANILNCGARAIGNGLAYKADGTPYWTQLFGSA